VKKKVRRIKTKTAITTMQDAEAKVEEEVLQYHDQQDEDAEQVKETATSEAFVSPNTEPPG
jgi:hypothetical protein